MFSFMEVSTPLLLAVLALVFHILHYKNKARSNK